MRNMNNYLLRLFSFMYLLTTTKKFLPKLRDGPIL